MKKLFLVFIVVLFFLFPNPSFAEVIRNFDTQIVANDDGTMNIEETIVYDFEEEERHGIFRYIPLYSQVGDLYRIIKIKDVNVQRDGEDEDFEENSDAKQINLKIGDPDVTITGPHTYKISYTVENGIGSNFPEHDEIYWNITGNEWFLVIEEASAKILTTNEKKSTQSLCFTGSLGSSQHNCTGVKGEYHTTLPLNPGEGLTIVEVFPKDTFPASFLSRDPPASFLEKTALFIKDHILQIYFLLNIILPILLIIWYQKKKNKKRFGNPSVNFDTPSDAKGIRITPAEAGTIDTAKLERDDVVSTLFDLAIRKYIRLEEVKKEKKLLKDSTDQKIVKLKDIDEKLNDFEKILMERIFKTGDSVNASDLKKDFYKIFADLEEKMFEDLVEKGYYIKNPKNQRAFLIFLTIASAFTLNWILSATFFWLSKKLNGRTQLGDEVDFRIDGLKLFLKSMDRNFKWQTEKFYTVEQMIPYAMALGYIDKFMEQLKVINPDYDPTWYRGYSGSFYRSYSGFYSSVSSSVTTSAPSSSSGFSGGSSGGGGGGGGGGSW